MAERDSSRVAPKRKYTEMGHEDLLVKIQTTEKRIGTLQTKVETMKKHALTLVVTDSQLDALSEDWSVVYNKWQDNMVLYEKDAVRQSEPFTEIIVWFGYDGTIDRLAQMSKYTITSHRLMIGDIAEILREISPEVIAFMRIHNVQIHAREVTYTIDTSHGEMRYSRDITDECVLSV